MRENRRNKSKKVNGNWGSRTHTMIITATYCLRSSESSQGWRVREGEGDGTVWAGYSNSLLPLG